MNRYLRYFLITNGVLFLVGCGSVNVDELVPNKTVEYKKEEQAGKDLEIPPDLTSDRISDRMSVPENYVGASTSYSEYVTDRKVRNSAGGGYYGSVLPKQRDIRVGRSGDNRWLIVNGPAEAVWPKIIDFWQENGILLVDQDPTVGVMRTSWVENRANIKRDFITDSVRKIFDGLYESSTRDQFRVRLERAGNNVTEVYLTHFGMEEEIVTTVASGSEQSVWVQRARDPQLEAEMLRRVMVYLGAADEKARARLVATGKRKPVRSQLVKTGEGVKLLIDDSFSRAWRLTGLALDRVGFAVEDRNRSEGIYYVRYNDPAAEDEKEGWLSSLKLWGDDVDKEHTYQVQVLENENNTEVNVLDELGNRQNSRTAIRILNLLHEQIR